MRSIAKARHKSPYPQNAAILAASLEDLKTQEAAAQPKFETLEQRRTDALTAILKHHPRGSSLKSTAH